MYFTSKRNLVCFKVYKQGIYVFLFEEFGSFSKTSFTFSYDHLTVTDHTHGTGVLYSSLRNYVSQEPSVSVQHVNLVAFKICYVNVTDGISND